MKQAKKKPTEPKVKPRPTEPKIKARPNIAFGRHNYIILIIGIIVIIFGFISLAKGSTVLAPILLVVGYCVIIPLAILIKSKPVTEKKVITETQSPSTRTE